MNASRAKSIRSLIALAAAASIVVVGVCGDAEARTKRHKRKAKKAPPGHVLVLGSSSVRGALGKHIEKRLVKRGFKVHRRGKSSAGLARPDYFDWLQEVDKLPISAATRAAVIYLGTNDGQAIHLRPAERKRYKHKGKWLRWGHEMWDRVYQSRVRGFAKKLCKAGVWRVAFMTPVDATNPNLLKKLDQIRRLQYRGARKSRCAWAFSGRGDWRQIRREKPGQPSARRLRYKDGFHMTQRGAERAWERIEKRVVRYINKRKPRRLRTGTKRRKRVKRRSARLAKGKSRRRPKG